MLTCRKIARQHNGATATSAGTFKLSLKDFLVRICFRLIYIIITYNLLNSNIIQKMVVYVIAERFFL